MVKLNIGHKVLVHPQEQVIPFPTTMAPFLRIAFNSYDLGVLPPLNDPPFCAIKMKEALTTGEKPYNTCHPLVIRLFLLELFWFSRTW